MKEKLNILSVVNRKNTADKLKNELAMSFCSMEIERCSSRLAKVSDLQFLIINKIEFNLSSGSSINIEVIQDLLGEKNTTQKKIDIERKLLNELNIKYESLLAQSAIYETKNKILNEKIENINRQIVAGRNTLEQYEMEDVYAVKKGRPHEYC